MADDNFLDKESLGRIGVNIQPETVGSQEHSSQCESDPFVTIDECMVSRKALQQGCCLKR